MTYCVGLRLSGGLVLLSDTMTNAGLDNISRFTKMFTFEKPGERAMALLTSGNLSITQGVIARLRYAIRCGHEDSGLETLMNAESMFQAAQKVGAEMARMQAENRETMLRHGASPDASILLAGQRRAASTGCSSSTPRATSSRRPRTRHSSSWASTSTASRSSTASSPPKAPWRRGSRRSSCPWTPPACPT